MPTPEIIHREISEYRKYIFKSLTQLYLILPRIVMKTNYILCCWLGLLLWPASKFNVNAYDKEMTIYVDAGKKECLYHSVKVGEIIDIEYQVIDGGHGDLDISFALLDPIGLVIVSDYKKPENLHQHEVQTEGDYRFCFDNSFSMFNRKTVFFELIVEREGDQNHGDQQWKDVNELTGLTPEEYYEMKVQDIMDFIGRLRLQLTKARQLQDVLRSHEARDRNLAEANFQKVNNWSLMQIIAMVGVGLIQVFMLRSIFETNGRMHMFWRKLGI
ncbi:transmembrane emp24 domain-containing protein 5 [Drosophila busckii]|nr:transmembrane emp24 domain-containing protein 5 [Drosophila busckii]